MVSCGTDASMIIGAIERELKTRVEAAMEKEIEAAKIRVEEMLRKEVAAITLQLLRYYDVATNKDGLVITVRGLGL